MNTILWIIVFFIAISVCEFIEIKRFKRQVADEFCMRRGNDGEIYPDPQDCQSYIYCSGGYAYRSTCSPGLFYSPATQACEHNNGECTTRPENEFKTENEVFISPPQPARPFPDNSQGSQRSRMDQEVLSVFCRDKQDGIYPSPVSCFHYVSCSNHAAFEAECPNGLVYSASIQGCDFDYNGQCSGENFENKISEITNDIHTTVSNHIEAIPGQINEMIMQEMPNAIEQAMSALTISLETEADLSVHMSEVDRPFRMVQRFLRAKPMAKQLSMAAFVLQNASAIMMSSMKMDKERSLEMLGMLSSPLPMNPNRLNPDDPYPKPEPGSCPWPSYNCRISKYRSFDGSCNNLKQPLLGRSFTPFQRFLLPNYGNGLDTLRLARHGGKLPEARLVSFTIVEDRNIPHHIHTTMLLQWGQFLDHDLSLTAISKVVTNPSGQGETENIQCGDDGCSNNHPDCAPIKVPSNDPNFFGKECLEFVRSEKAPNVNCTLGPREQLNQITAFIDASNVYGSTRDDADHVRDLSDPRRGKLKMMKHPGGNHKDLLPPNMEDKECKKVKSEQHCFLAGDERVNEQNFLTTMHTMWVREHNYIEKKLAEINPRWSGDTLYHETRRIIGAVMQHITYNEFLPVVLGQETLERYEIKLLENGFFSGYDKNIDPRISNGFATAAFRFGHSLIQPVLERGDRNYSTHNYSPIKLREVFFRPENVYNTKEGGVDAFVRGLCSQNVQSMDRFVTKEVTAHLFSLDPPNGLGTDLVSLNIQRARDHGIPGYNAWRQWCGLGIARNFDDLKDIIDERVRGKFRQLYRHVDDIDLFPAGIAEKQVSGGLVGPTFACIIGQQFKHLRRGDRFWYENAGAYSFTSEQLDEIRKITLAKVLCRNGDDISKIQPNVMELPFRKAYSSPKQRQQDVGKSGLTEEWFARLWMANYNKRVDCNCIDDIDLSLWKEIK